MLIHIRFAALDELHDPLIDLIQAEARTLQLRAFQFDASALTLRAKDPRLTRELRLPPKPVAGRLDIRMHRFPPLQFPTHRARRVPRLGFAERNPLDQARAVENMENLHKFLVKNLPK